jgi:capsular exopolysaccharide synthesis family protein
LSTDQLASILWRRRRVFILTLALCIAAVVLITLALPKTYKATATLLVGTKNQLVTTDLLDQITRTYATLAGNPNVATDVVGTLPEPITRDELLSKMSFVPIQSTSLLTISASDHSAADAARIANTYATVFVQRVGTSVDREQAQGTTITLSERAVVPTSPAKPNPPLYIGLGTLLGLLIAFAVALLRERLDTRLRVAPEDDALLGQPILARIPRFADRDAPPREMGDRFALLKTNIDFLDERPARVVMVTSAGVGEGKSTVSASLAAACAADGERVVLLEADLRRPALEQALALRDHAVRSDKGLTNYLIDAAEAREVVRPQSAHAGLDVIWSGPHPPNPSALLGSPRLDTLLDLLRERYERVIIDTAPISVAADSSVLASRIDGTIFVVDESKTKRPDAQAALNQLAKVRAHVLGVVLNRSERDRGETYYYYRRRDETTAADEPAPRRRRVRV